MATPQECSQKGDTGNTSPRGIRNDVSRVSCHVACAIQILCHAIPSVSSALQKLAVLPNTGPFPELLLLEELIDFVRVENNSNPWNPQRLYEYLQDAASIDYRNVGDATRSLTCLLSLLSQQESSWKKLLEASVWEGETLQILEGRRAIDDENTSQFLQRIKPATKSKPMASPLILKFCSEHPYSNSWCLGKALEEIVQPKTMQGSTYPWDSISPTTYTEQVITFPGDANHNNDSEETNNKDGDDSNGDSDSDESDSDSDSDSDSNDGNKWSTSKRLEIQRIPRVWLLHLDRPLVSINKLQKSLSTKEPNQEEEEGQSAHFSLMDHVNIPLELNPSFINTKDGCTDKNSHGDEMSDKLQNQSLFLRGAIVQVVELDGSETEEDWEGGHSATLLRDSIGDASWWLIDDDMAKKVSEEHATRMMGGVLEKGKNKSDAYFCATLLVYAVKDDVFHDKKPFENEILYSWNERNKQLEAAVGSQQALVGKRLKVKWAKGKFYAGNVTRYDASTGKHEVTYDDGDVKEYNLTNKAIKWID
mmetsp:Transcript_11611/g.29381  ORF Transcript_11611/g.29381 Transcript_11611/m.29381 type:complete len:534 (+) Transcript_11611:110-1711(+)